LPLFRITDMNRLDDYDIRPEGMDNYLSYNGYHFSKKMCEWAISRMRDMNDKPIHMMTYEQVETLLKNYGVTIENDNGYDKVFVLHMCLSDYIGSSVPDEGRAAKYVKDVLDDRDGYPGIAFSRFLADCAGKGVSIRWEDLL